jgi:uncharacterized protein YegP (UPF0339 family)
MAAKFEIQSPKAGQYQWVLVSQGRVLATSAPYNRRALCEKSIVPFRMAAVNAPVNDMTQPAVGSATRKVARVAGRAVAKAVVTGGRAVEKAEKVAVKAAKTTARKARAATR